MLATWKGTMGVEDGKQTVSDLERLAPTAMQCK